MTVRDTSRAAYDSIRPALGAMHTRVLKGLADKMLTRAELARDTGIPTSSMSGRINELIKLGAVVEGIKFPCSVSGKSSRLVYRADLVPK